MKKGRNSEGSSGRRFTLPKSKILRGRSNFDRLFDGNAVVFNNESLQLRFKVYHNDESDYKMAFIVPKRLGNAVRRNRMKRRMKESFRLNQFILAEEIASARCVFHGALMANATDSEYESIKSNVISLLLQAQNYLFKTVER